MGRSVKEQPATVLRKLLASLLLLVAVPLFAGEDWQDIVFGPFGGLYNRETKNIIPQDKSWALENVDVTPGGKSIKRRSGYLTAFSLSPSTSPIHNMYLFYNSTGTDISLFFNERRMNASISGAATSVIYSTATNEAVWDCADYLGFAYCVNSARDALFKTSGTFVSNIAITSTGTMVAALPTRLAMAGFSGSAASRIDLSAETDFTSWGTGSLGSSPVQVTINSPGSRITHIVYAFGRLMWFKESSFGYIITGVQPAQTDWVIKTVSNSIGTLDNTSTTDPDGNLYFRGQDKRIYKFDGNSVSEFSSDILGTIRTSTYTTTEQSYATYFDNKLWFSVALNGSATNSEILIYDFLSGGWTTYSIPANGFLVRNNQLYFGSPAFTSNVYVFGSTTTDAGSIFTTTWASKSMFFNSPFQSFDLVNVSAFAYVATSTITFSVQRDGAFSTNYSFNLFPSTPTTSVYVNKNVRAGSPFHTIGMYITDSTTTPWEIFALRAGVRPRSWRPEP
jgi:hypothetical protein